MVIALVAVVISATACGGDGGGGSGGATITMNVVDGELVGGPRTENVGLGATVHMEVTGNTDDEVHIHGYDEHIELVDGAGSVDFTADIPGTFEVELEGSGALLIRLTVS